MTMCFHQIGHLSLSCFLLSLGTVGRADPGSPWFVSSYKAFLGRLVICNCSQPLKAWAKYHVPSEALPVFLQSHCT